MQTDERGYESDMDEPISPKEPVPNLISIRRKLPEQTELLMR
jgi:hypothetical protein